MSFVVVQKHVIQDDVGQTVTEDVKGMVCIPTIMKDSTGGKIIQKPQVIYSQRSSTTVRNITPLTTS